MTTGASEPDPTGGRAGARWDDRPLTLFSHHPRLADGRNLKRPIRGNPCTAHFRKTPKRSTEKCTPLHEICTPLDPESPTEDRIVPTQPPEVPIPAGNPTPSRASSPDPRKCRARPPGGGPHGCAGRPFYPTYIHPTSPVDAQRPGRPPGDPRGPTPDLAGRSGEPAHFRSPTHSFPGASAHSSRYSVHTSPIHTLYVHIHTSYVLAFSMQVPHNPGTTPLTPPLDASTLRPTFACGSHLQVLLR